MSFVVTHPETLASPARTLQVIGSGVAGAGSYAVNSAASAISAG